MMIFLILKLAAVVAVLIFFWRRPTIVWGIGLLTVTTAVLLDTFLGTFGRDPMSAELGFFLDVIRGALVGGAAIWVWGLLRPLTAQAVAPAMPAPLAEPNLPETADSSPAAPTAGSTAFDRRMLYEEIRTRFGRDDVLDLLFDLEINENDVMVLGQDMNQLIVNLMGVAEERGQTGALALAVERILTPPPPENLPRLEKITADSPPTILRQYLLAHYRLADLQNLAAVLELDWEQLAGSGKKAAVRNLLLYLQRRNRLDELLTQLHTASVAETSE